MDDPNALVIGRASFETWKDRVLDQFRPRRRHKRVLIVDDDPQFVEMLEFHLADLGYSFLSLMNGRQAVRIAMEQDFDVILMDVRLRDISGYQVARDLSEALGDRCPKIVIVTGREVAKERGLVLLSGATAILQKPLNFREFDRTLSTLMSADN